MDPIHIGYLKEIAEANPLIWDDKYLEIETIFGEINPDLLSALTKIFTMYEKNTDPNIDQRFYDFIRNHSHKIRYSIHYSIMTLLRGEEEDKTEEDMKLHAMLAYMSYQIDSFSTVDDLKKSYKNGEMYQVIFKGYGTQTIKTESLEQYIVFHRANLMCKIEECLEFIPKINLDNEEFSPTYQRILPHILNATSGMRTKSARINE